MLKSVFILLLVIATTISASIVDYYDESGHDEGSGNHVAGSPWFDGTELHPLITEISNIRLKHEIDVIKSSIEILKTTLRQNMQDIKELLTNRSQVSNEPPTDLESEFPLEYAQNNTQIAPESSTSCAEILHYHSPSGVYTLHLPDSGLEPFEVYCLKDPNRGPAWTIVQRRQDGSVDFYRDWKEYKIGFGNLSGEYFIGLEKLHALTTDGYLQELWIELEDFKGEKRHAYYELFAIGNEYTKYTLMNLGKYTGDAGDSLKDHKGSKFSTKDNDNDISNKSCSASFTAAWWYYNCFMSDLNGKYLHDGDSKGTGIQWRSWQQDVSLKYTHIAIRPIK